MTTSGHSVVMSKAFNEHVAIWYVTIRNRETQRSAGDIYGGLQGHINTPNSTARADSLDGPFIRDLQWVASFFVQKGFLFLELAYDCGTMKYRSKD